MNAERLKQIEEIYHAALEIPLAGRESFFKKQCGADALLRREVESLLSFGNTADKFIDAPPAPLAAEMFAGEETGALFAGREISHYKIKRLLGAGGMGEVYLAEDTRLNRKVALKILPESFAADARRLSRFEREARAASALNHPNILTVHEFGSDAGVHFLATEFIDGETLRERVAGGEELSLTEALKIAEQAAFALVAAHAAGIVHRDIKPENIMIRADDGIVKVLDFGIAKLTAAAALDAEGETLAKPDTHTKPGMMVGTLRYMSPEQVRGKPLDARSDVFSLGICLYEMLTGADPFARATSGDIIAAILTENPPPVTRGDAPAELERILSKALKKNRDERYQTSKDFLLDLKALRREIEFGGDARRTDGEKALTTGEIAEIDTTNPAARGGLSLTKWLAIFLAAAFAIGSAFWFASKRAVENENAQRQTAPTTVEVVNWRSTPGEIYSAGELSPDGKMVVFSSTKTGAKNIWIKQIAGGEAVQITKDEFGSANPVWSASGDEIAFVSVRGGTFGVWRMPSLGGSPTFIKAVEDNGATLRRWGTSGAIYYESQGNLFRINVSSGETSQLTDFDSAKTSASSFTVSPDETQIACVEFKNEHSTILTMPAAGGAPKEIFSSTDEIRNAVWHADGRRVLFSQNVNGVFQIFAADALVGSGNNNNNKPAQVTFGERDSLALAASTDGAKILYGSSKEESDIWGADVERAEEFSFASDIDSELWAAAAPDGKRVAFQSIKNLSQGDKLELGAILIKRTGADEPPFQLAANALLPVWSPDGARVAFARVAGETYNLWTANAAGGGEKQLTNGAGLTPIEYNTLPYNRVQTADFSWSPDNGKIAYVSNEEPHNIWLIDASDTSRVQLTDNADTNLLVFCPLWLEDGKRIAFTSKTNDVSAYGKRYFTAWVVDVETKTAKQIEKTENFQRLLGFSASGKELFLAEIKNKSPKGLPTEVTITEADIETGARRTAMVLDATYLYNIYLSADKKMLAYASNKDGKDNIWIARLDAGAAARRITSNTDARLYFSALAWSPDDRTIYFGKQTRYSLLSMVANFK